MRIDLHIDRLVLDGLPPSDAAGLQTAIAAELMRLFSAGELSPLPPLLRGGGALASAPAGRFEAKADGASTGALVGRAVHTVLTGSP